MPRIKLTKTAIDDLSPRSSDVIYWDAALPGFGVKVTPKGRKVFIVVYRTGGAGSNYASTRSVVFLALLRSPAGQDPHPRYGCVTTDVELAPKPVE